MLSRYIAVLVVFLSGSVLVACGLLGGEPEPPVVPVQQPAPQSEAPPAAQQVPQQPPSQVPTALPPPAAPWQRGPQAELAPQFLMAFGEAGIEPGQLSGPIGVAVDAEGNIYVGDNKSLQKFDPEGRYLLSFGPDGYAGLTTAVAVGPDGNIYRSDPKAHMIFIYTPDGQDVGTLGEPGSGEGQFKEPFGLTFDAAGNLYVVDRRNFRVQKFDPAGNFLMSFGSRGDRNGEFINPRDVAVDSAGNIYVTDQVSYLFQKFSPTGEFITRIGQSHGGETLWLTRGIAIDDQDRVYISDGLHARIQAFDSEGVFLFEFGLPGSEPGNFFDPDDIEIRDGKLYVADKGNDRIQVFALQP